jgi:hypothetical protein
MDTSENDIRQVAVPVAARALCTLTRIDYEDAFLVENVAAEVRTAEQWARAILEDAPPPVKGKVLLGWLAIGLRPTVSASRRSVLGWEIRASTPDFVLLGRASLIGMPGQLLFKRERDALLFATFVQHHNPIARAVWAATEPRHVPIVRDLLDAIPTRRLAVRTPTAAVPNTDASAAAPATPPPPRQASDADMTPADATDP